MSGGSSSTHHYENTYDDAWIRNWTSDAEGREQSYASRLKNLENWNDDRVWENQQQQQQIANLQDWGTDYAKFIQHKYTDTENLRKNYTDTAALNVRLSNQANQFNEALASKTENWNRVSEGWDRQQDAWNQTEADWANRYDQQQRAIETQLATEKEEYDAELKSIQDIYGIQRQEDRTAWEQQAAEQRAGFTEQLQNYQLESDAQAEALRQSFAQSQEQQRIADAIQTRDLSAQLSELGNQWQRDWALGSQALTDDYTNLINQASSDAERARLEQARDFDRLQQDQLAAYNQSTQELAAQDRVFGTQIDELRRDLGIETDLLGSAQRDFASQSQAERARLEQSLQGLGQQSEAARQQLASGLGQDISSLSQASVAARQQLASGFGQDIASLSQASEAARQQLASGLGQDISSLSQASEAARQGLQENISGLGQSFSGLQGDFSDLQGNVSGMQEDVTYQLGGFREDIKDYKATLAEQKSAQDEYYDANRRFREMQIQDAERARTAASYGSPGTTLNKQVKGVRRAGSSQPGGLVRSRTPRNVFNRSGLRISSLNI